MAGKPLRPLTSRDFWLGGKYRIGSSVLPTPDAWEPTIASNADTSTLDSVRLHWLNQNAVFQKEPQASQFSAFDMFRTPIYSRVCGKVSERTAPLEAFPLWPTSYRKLSTFRVGHFKALVRRLPPQPETSAQNF